MILIIDDEPRIMDSYRDYLERMLEPDGFQVFFCNDVDEGFAFFEAHSDELDLIILDIMMPPGRVLSNKGTNGGLKTGLVFYDWVRERLPTLPVMIFTNYFDEEMEKAFRQDRNCRFLQKSDYLLKDFVAEVRRLLPS